MHSTIFDSRVLAPFLRRIALRVLALRGWKVEGDAPEVTRYVLICAPHTSNWDFPLTMLICFALKLKIYWMGKDSLFRWPFKSLARWLGGIAVDRARGSNLVQATIDAFGKNESLVIAVAPEGTRAKVTHWKTGFYHIAKGAGVPIAMAYLDYQKKTGGIGMLFYPTGDIDADMREIQQFYRGVSGKNRQAFHADDIRLKSD